MTKSRDAQVRALQRQKQRRDAFLADKVCAECGGSDYLLVSWANPPGPMDVSKVWAVGDERRESLLALTVVRCSGCRGRRTGDLLRGVHGGGSQGIAGCKCLLCRAKKSQYNTLWRQRKRDRDAALAALRSGETPRPRGTMGP